MNHHKKTLTKHYATKITLATLSVGALIAPVQAAIGHLSTALASSNGFVTIKAELHPHHTDHGSWHGHYINPRALRAIGYGDGKEVSTDMNDNWKYYETIRA